MMIFIVKGSGKHGKTTVLKKLIRRLLNDARFRLYEKCKNFDANMDIPERDVWAKFCYGGIHILITTFGDSAKEVGKSIRNAGCEIVVCALHPNYKSYDGPWHDCEIVEIPKSAVNSENERALADEQFVNDLFDKLLEEAEVRRVALQGIF